MPNATEPVALPSPSLPSKKPLLLPLALLAVATFLAIYLTMPSSFQIRWNDETLYFTVAKNIYFEGDFNSHHYLSESLLRKGYPTKDTHPPGYPLLMATSFLFFGVGETAAYLQNYSLLFATLLLLFFMGRELGNATTGLGAALLFLVNPLTLSLTQSIMSEISAALAVTWVCFVLLMIEDGYLKGLLLAVGIALATLIKPFLLVLIPACFLFFWIHPGEFRSRSILALTVSFALLAGFVVFPLSSNREYYPSSINDLFLQPSAKAKLQYAMKNFVKNFRLSKALPWKSGELAVLLFGFAYLLLPFAALIRRKRLPWTGLYAAVAFAFSTTLLAVFFIYEYPAWRGSRAIFAFFPVLALLGGIGLTRLRPAALGAVFALGLGAINLYYAKSSFDVLEKSKLRQSAILNQYANRTDKNLARYGLQPKVLLSTNNLYLAVGRYPVKIILSEPRTLADFAKIEALLPPDALELRPGGPLFQANLRLNGEARFGSNYELAGQGDGFYYYRRR